MGLKYRKWNVNKNGEKGNLKGLQVKNYDGTGYSV